MKSYNQSQLINLPLQMSIDTLLSLSMSLTEGLVGPNGDAALERLQYMGMFHNIRTSDKQPITSNLIYFGWPAGYS